ncbi:MAG: 5-(carboxyamino)imidazole ribonucleotide synthase [Candidatus Sumerlaeia bacterium]|nr:5-(carboxyamino)imidazole ribonucleotide synthase [Candidatus Sumerlaeia bacterium]
MVAGKGSPLIGILGGGQLGQMLALAGIPLGLRFRVFDPSPDCCARLCSEHVCAPYEDIESLKRFADGLDLLTYEFENVPTSALDALSSVVDIHPNRRALETSQDRLLEKRFFSGLGIEVAPYFQVDALSDLEQGLNEFEGRGILKTRRFGYDGKGQVRLNREVDTASAWVEFGEKPSVLEAFVPFEREVSMIGARSQSGEIATYPLIENVHRGGILRRSTVPANASDELELQARHILTMAMEALEYRGLLTIEFFVVGEKLVVNEMAPRVHNSGHLTMEAFATSQFEQHLRAVCNYPLGSTRLVRPAVMLNAIGSIPEIQGIASFPEVAYHHYGKENRPGRKVGHVTVLGDTGEEVERHVQEILKKFPELG